MVKPELRRDRHPHPLVRGVPAIRLGVAETTSYMYPEIDGVHPHTTAILASYLIPSYNYYLLPPMFSPKQLNHPLGLHPFSWNYLFNHPLF